MHTDIVLTGTLEPGLDLTVGVSAQRTLVAAPGFSRFDFITRRDETWQSLAQRVAETLNAHHGTGPHAIRAGYEAPNTVRVFTPFGDASWRPQVTVEASGPLVASIVPG